MSSRSSGRRGSASRASTPRRGRRSGHSSSASTSSKASRSATSKLIGNKTSGYTSWLTRPLGIQPRGFEEARLKGIKEKVRKYERRPFSGTDEDKAYLFGMRHGDLSIDTLERRGKDLD
jgi:hypothetical protein